MKQLIILLFMLLGCESTIAAEVPPAWAYAQNPPNAITIPANDSLRRVPKSEARYSFSQVKDLFFAPDWHPQDHTPLPNIVEYGRKPNVYACGFCHRANGSGGPENASLAGLPKTYIIQQMADFKSGARTSAVANRAPFNGMQAVANAVGTADIEAAANYFSGLKPQKNINVIETNSVPLTYERGWHLAITDIGTTEPLGRRIIEVPKTLDDFISRDSRAQFNAYVPKGSIIKGKKISQKRSNLFTCEKCHGNNLRGKNDVPALAGRSPSYIVRQLYDFKLGFRVGENAQPMLLAVKDLNPDDIINIAAYAASLKP